MGWLEKEELLLPGRNNSVAALWHPCDGKVNRGGEAPMTRVGQVAYTAAQEVGVRVPAAAFPVRPSSQYCNCNKCVKNPIQKSLKFYLEIFFSRLLSTHIEEKTLCNGTTKKIEKKYF